MLVAATTAIKTTIEEGLAERSRILGEKLLKGLLAGMEFAENDIAALVITGCGRRDLLVAYSPNNPKVVRVESPLIIQESEFDRVLTPEFRGVRMAPTSTTDRGEIDGEGKGSRDLDKGFYGRPGQRRKPGAPRKTGSSLCRIQGLAGT